MCTWSTFIVSKIDSNWDRRQTAAGALIISVIFGSGNK